MAKILPLNAQPPAKFGFERVKRRRRDPENHGQLNLFSGRGGSSARLLRMPEKMTPFEQALMFDEREDQKARELYQEAISAGDCVADAYCNLGILESKANKTDAAFDCFTKSLREDPRHLESHYNLGNLYFEMDNRKLAKEHYEIAARIDPGFPNIYFNLGLLMAIGEDLQGAVKALRKYQELVSESEAQKTNDLLQTLLQSLAARN